MRGSRGGSCLWRMCAPQGAPCKRAGGREVGEVRSGSMQSRRRTGFGSVGVGRRAALGQNDKSSEGSGHPGLDPVTPSHGRSGGGADGDARRRDERESAARAHCTGGTGTALSAAGVLCAESPERRPVSSQTQTLRSRLLTDRAMGMAVT